MKRLILAIAEFCAAAFGCLVWGAGRAPNLQQFAYPLKAAIVSRHTTI